MLIGCSRNVYDFHLGLVVETGAGVGEVGFVEVSDRGVLGSLSK